VKNNILSVLLLAVHCTLIAQDVSLNSLPASLKTDTAYNYIQFYDADLAKRFVAHFDHADSDKVVILHFGDSHIQAERPTSYVRRYLQQDYGDGGRGMIFNYAAANSYTSVNYTTAKQGEWNFAKSYQIPPKLPLGVTGMTAETTDGNAELTFSFKNTIPQDAYKILVFFENDEVSCGFNLLIDTSLYTVTKEQIDSLAQNFIEIEYSGEINEISLALVPNTFTYNFFRFYGIDIEKQENKGVVYQSLGVGAASMRAILYLDKLTEQASLLHPDIALLDFGTNDIINNEISPDLRGVICQAINKLREINPDMVIILTSTQDLCKRGKYVTVGEKFRDLVDAIAQSEHTMFWNWYDLSGGLYSITDWSNAGYAQPDGVHLTSNGYAVKGSFLYSSFKNTIDLVKNNPDIQEYSVPSKEYTIISKKQLPVARRSGVTHKIKSGETLSSIARKYHTTVIKLKQANNLKSDLIRAGQTLKIPR